MSEPLFLSVKPDVPADSYWDMTFLKDLLSDMPESDRKIVVIPGAYQGDVIPKINKVISQYEKVLVFVTSDEEGKFDCEKLEHPDMIHYTQYGRCQRRRDFPIGYTTETRRCLKAVGLVDKDIDTFFSGQLNSDERRNMFSKVANIPKSILYATGGFAQGLAAEEYYSYMAHAQFAPAPGGHVSPDSFRFYEALEAGCIPTFIPVYVKGMFLDMPVYKEGWDFTNNNEVFAWWITKKVQLKQQIRKDLGIEYTMTVVVPTSPIPSHPSLEVIEQTIKSIRHHTAMDIIITIDGIRPEQEHMREAYNQYIQKLLWKCNFEWENVMPIYFKEHVHQSGMMRKALEYIKTPLLLYVEHDTPLVTDKEIEWKLICEKLMDGTFNVVRFHYESQIPEDHHYLMLDFIGDKFLQTIQWSQRPHVARREFYRDVMTYFSDEAKCFIEDRAYTYCVAADWNDWRVAIYTPRGDMKRSLNLDGRAGDRKFDKEGEQIW